MRARMAQNLLHKRLKFEQWNAYNYDDVTRGDTVYR